MMHKTIKTGIVIALLGLSACSQKLAMDEGIAAAPVVVVEEPAALEHKNICTSTDMDDGIGGTGCPALVE